METLLQRGESAEITFLAQMRGKGRPSYIQPTGLEYKIQGAWWREVLRKWKDNKITCFENMDCKQNEIDLISFVELRKLLKAEL